MHEEASNGGELVAEVASRLERVGLAEGASTCCPAAAVCPALSANVLSVIGQHLSLEERLIAGGTCKLWRTALHEGTNPLLQCRLDDGSSTEARRHSAQAWAGLLVAAAGAVAAAGGRSAVQIHTRACVTLSSNLMSGASAAVLLSGLAAHTQLQHLSVIQAPHRSAHTLPARPCAENGRLRRRARWARPPLTVFPSWCSRELYPLCARLTNLVSLSLRDCVFMPGFDTWMHELRRLQRLELVPTQDHVCTHIRGPGPRGRMSYYFPRQMRFCLAPSSWPSGRSAALTSLCLGACLASPTDLASLASRLPQLKALRLESVPLDECLQPQRYGMPAGGLQRELGAVLREEFTHLDVLDVSVCVANSRSPHRSLYDCDGAVRQRELRALEAFLIGLAGAGMGTDGSSSNSSSSSSSSIAANGSGSNGTSHGTSHGSSTTSAAAGAGADGSPGSSCKAAGAAATRRAAMRLAGSYDVLVHTERPEIARLLAAIGDPDDTLVPRVVTIGGRGYGVMAEAGRDRVAAGLAAWLPLSEAEAAWQRARVEEAAAGGGNRCVRQEEQQLESYVGRWGRR